MNMACIRPRSLFFFSLSLSLSLPDTEDSPFLDYGGAQKRSYSDSKVSSHFSGVGSSTVSLENLMYEYWSKKKKLNKEKIRAKVTF